MNNTFKRVLSFALALVLVLGMVPVMGMDAQAAGTLSVTDANVGLSWTDASNSKGKANWSASGTTVTGTATGYKGGMMNLVSYAVTTALTITNNHSDDRTLSFDYALTGGGSVSGTISSTSGSYSAPLAAGASTTITLTSPKGTGTNTLTLSGLQLLSSGSVTSTFLAPENGSYTVDGAAVTAQTTKEKAATEAYALAATPAANYVFFGWWSEASRSYVSYEATASLKFASDPQLKPVFLHKTTALFGVGTQTFADLTEAANFAASSAATTKTVVLLNNGTVSGSHTIPAGVTLLVPHNSSNTMYGSSPKCTTETTLGFANAATDWVQPTAYRTLTLAANAQITVNGSIELAGQHAASNGSERYCGSPSGPIGWVKMLSGSNITLNSGSNLYSWGYIQGSGTITAKSGSKVYENFQFTDFRGGSNTSALATEGLVFPINQYYVQNIEVATTYEYGAEEHIATSIFMSRQVFSATVKFMGNGGMFIPASGATITKDYIENRDRLQIDVNGNGTLNSMSLSLGGTDINSATYVLPLTNNITINIHSGTTTANQSVALLPGVEMTVDNGATLTISKGNGGINDYTTESYGLIVYDYDEWTYGINLADGSVVTGKFAFGKGSANHSGQMSPLVYAPGRTYNRTVAKDLVDAKLNVNGTIICDGYLYTTVGGGNIMSSEKTGTIVFQSGAGVDMYDFQANEAAALVIPMNSAALKNGDGSYENTYVFSYNDVGDLVVDYQAPAGTVYNYCAAHDQWYTGECADCSVTYDITFDGNGAEMGSAATVNASGVITLPGMSFYKTGYTQSGWNTQADGKGTHYDLSASYTVSAAATLYAEWTLNKNELTFSIDGKTTSSQVAYGETVNAPTVTAPDGYHLAGWTDADDNVITFPFTMPDRELTVIAQFEQHDFATEVAGSRVDATCSAAGSVTMKCDCGATKVVTLAIDPAKHNPGAAADCENAQTCTLCGEVLEAAKGHTPGAAADCNNAQTCTLCGEVLEAAKGHTPGAAADCNNAQTCTVCGEVLEAAKGHTPKAAVEENRTEATCGANGSYESVVYCSVCGEELSRTPNTIPATGAHVDSNDADHACDACGEVIETHTPAAAVEENRVDATCGTDGSYDSVVYCSECHEELTRTPTTIPATGAHIDGDDDDHDCDNCGEPNVDDGCTEGAPVKENVVTETCTTAGSYDSVVYCTECRKELSRVNVGVDALGHDWNEPTYTWSADGSAYTAQRVCATDASHVETANAQITAEQTKAPTCTEMGETTYTAVFAEDWAEGDSLTLTDISATGHTPDDAVIENKVDADCDTDGSYDTVVYCSVCNAELSRETTTVPALGHSPAASVIENEVAADCDTDGSYDTVVYCSVCDAELSRETTTVPAKNHNPGRPVRENRIEPDCVNPGSYENAIYCTVCGEEWSRVIIPLNPLGHSPAASVIENEVAADCDTDGSYDTVVYCSVCNAELSRETTTVPALGHSPAAAVTENEIAASCETDGSYDTVVYCGVCGAELSRETTTVPAKDHAWGEPSYSADGEKCVASYVCGNDASHTKQEELTHNYVDGTCSNCGDVLTFTITWVNEGEIIEVDENVPYGAVPTFDSRDKLGKEGNAQFTYIFQMWSPNVHSVNGDCTYTAKYTATLNYYTVKFVNEDGTELQRGALPYGATPVYNGETPTKEGSAEVSYTFAGWDAEISPVTGEATYTATFTETANSYTLYIQMLSVSGDEDLWYHVVEISVPCGALLKDYIPENGNGMPVYAPGMEIPVSGTVYNGIYTIGAWCDLNWNALDLETAAMPANDLTIMNDYYYTGWCEKFWDSAAQEWSDTSLGTTYQINSAEVEGWQTIDGNQYYFAYDEQQFCHFLCKDITLIDGSFYAFDHDTGKFLSDYTGIYEALNGDLYYVENGIAAQNKGMVRVIGSDNEVNYYYFGCGQASCKAEGCAEDVYTARKNCVHWSEIDNGLLVRWDYTFNADGTVVHDDAYAIHENPEEPLHEIVTYDGVKYYTIDGVKVHYGLFMIGEDYYYARSSGALVAGRSYWITITNDLPIAEGSYAFDADGKMIVPKPEDPEEPEAPKNGIYEEDGGLFYYVDGKRTYAGLICYTGVSETGVVYDNALIYVRTSGQLAIGSYWPTKTNDLMETTRRHNFDANGIMTDPPVPEVPVEPKNGIYEEDGSLYYYENDVRTYAGLIKIDGNYYYVRTSGELAHSCKYWPTKTNGLMNTTKQYTFNEQGVMVDAPAELP